MKREIEIRQEIWNFDGELAELQAPSGAFAAKGFTKGIVANPGLIRAIFHSAGVKAGKQQALKEAPSPEASEAALRMNTAARDANAASDRINALQGEIDMLRQYALGGDRIAQLEEEIKALSQVHAQAVTDYNNARGNISTININHSGL